ncbi:GTP 3',8-cyclase [subsurface metagenome]
MAKIAKKLRTLIYNPQNAPLLIWRRLGSKSSYTFSSLLKAKALPPEAINFYPTDRCNLKCSMCFERLRKPNPEMEIEGWIKIIDQIKRFQPRIHLSGGEPFVYPGIVDLISYIKKSGLFLVITTNGTFLSEYAKEIIRMKVNRIHISIDGPKQIHDKIRGVKGTFNRIMTGLAKMNKLKKHSRLPVIRINSMLNFTNEPAMQEVIKIAYDIQAESIQFLHPLFIDSKSLAVHRLFLKKNLHHNLNYWQAADISCNTPENFTKIQNLLENLQKERGIPIEIFPSFNPEQLKAYYNVDPYFYSIFPGKCRAMWETVTILASGDVESCPDYILGNCSEENFDVLWNNKKMRTLRRRIKNNQLFPVCRACCYFYD